MATVSRRSAETPAEAQRGEPPVRQFVGFRIGDEHYAIAITKIQEIILMKPITRLPQAAESVEGLINLRGNIIPVVNLRKRFGLAAREFDDETRTVVGYTHGKTVGYVVDEVTQVMRVAADQIQSVPVSVSGPARRFISGIAQVEDRLLIILEIDRLFAPDELELEVGPGATDPGVHLHLT
jgi:purine-binding chemotaxis protein CheW